MLAVTLWAEQWRIDLCKTLKAMDHDTDVPFERLEKVYVPDEDSLEQSMNIFHGMASFAVFTEITANVVFTLSSFFLLKSRSDS